MTGSVSGRAETLKKGLLEKVFLRGKKNAEAVEGLSEAFELME